MCLSSTLARLLFAALALSYPSAMEISFAQDASVPAVSKMEVYRPITDGDVQLAQQALIRARDEFRRAAIDTKVISGWEAYFSLAKWCDANTAQSEPPPELEQLTQQLAQGIPGMEWPPLQSLRQSLLAFANRWRDRHDPKLEEKVALRLALLQSILASPAPTSQQQSELATIAHWLARHGQSPELLNSLSQRNRSSNLRMTIGRYLISSYMHEPIDRPEVVSDEILGTTVSGTGQAVGFADVELIPNPNMIAFEIVATMCVRTNTVASKGPVRVYSNGATQIQSRKPVYFDGKQLSASSARSTASTDSVTTGISTNFKRLANRLVTRIAEKEIEKKKEEGNAVAASHAERDASTETDLDVSRIIAETNAEFRNEVEIPLARRGFSLQHLLCSTTTSAFHINVGAAGIGQLLAPPPPGEFKGSSDLQFQVHPTAINNAATTYVAGDWYWLSDLTEKSKSPEGASIEPAKDRSSDVGIMLDSFEPLTASFDEGEIRLVIRGERFVVQSQEWPAMDITLHLRPQFNGGAAELVSTKEPAVFPPGKTTRLSGREVTLRRILIDRLKKELAKPIKLSPMPVKRDERVIGNLALESLKTTGGWLEGGLKFAPVSGANGIVIR